MANQNRSRVDSVQGARAREAALVEGRGCSDCNHVPVTPPSLGQPEGLGAGGIEGSSLTPP